MCRIKPIIKPEDVNYKKKKAKVLIYLGVFPDGRIVWRDCGLFT
jgi:hypothetical protein